jgi:hypothetical protein
VIAGEDEGDDEEAGERDDDAQPARIERDEEQRDGERVGGVTARKQRMPGQTSRSLPISMISEASRAAASATSRKRGRSLRGVHRGATRSRAVKSTSEDSATSAQ